MIQDHAYLCPIHLYDIKRKRLIDRTTLIADIKAGLKEKALKLTFPSSYTLLAFTKDFMSIIYHLGRYAILSHRWSDEELTFGDSADLDSEAIQQKQGFKKFQGFCQVASERYDCRYIWLDTLCIDKRSSSELEESIQSMYTWYKSAYVCIVYLDASDDCLNGDSWFKRGWTLQELLASRRVKFLKNNWMDLQENTIFDVDHVTLGSLEDCAPFERGYSAIEDTGGTQEVKVRHFDDGDHQVEFLKRVSEAAGIEQKFLRQYYHPSPDNAIMVYRWIANRTTTRPEDIVYCLFGLLHTRIPIVYGEGKSSAFYRLQLACAQVTDDRMLFIWNGRPSKWSSMLADDPCAFVLQDPETRSRRQLNQLIGFGDNGDLSFSFTNHGLHLPVHIYDITRARIYKGNTKISWNGTTTEHSLRLQLAGASHHVETRTVMTVDGLAPEVKEILEWKVAAIGHDSEKAWAILLGPRNKKGFYKRVSVAGFLTFGGDVPGRLERIFVR